MFWRWFEPWGFMNTERGHHRSQFESLSQRLFGLTFWGDYGGDIISRYHYSMLLEDCPLAVGSIEAAHGQGLVLIAVEPDNEAYRDQLREVIRLLAHFDPEAAAFEEYPIYDEWGFSDWEFKLIDTEMNEGWWAEYTHGDLVNHFSDWEDNTLVPDIGTEAWSAFLNDFYFVDGDCDQYWEGADSLIVEGFDIEEAADWLLDQYARSITNAGNPPTLDHYAQSVAEVWNTNRDL